MALMLGIDTGGTYTDAVLVDDGPGHRVHATAKAPTTHGNLAVGVDAAIERVLAALGPGSGAAVALVSVSTTLATNALVEGHGDSAALITFGFGDREVERSGILSAVAPELIGMLDGGHDAHGQERAPLDAAAVTSMAERLAPRVGAFAVAAQFSVRNPTHEQVAAELIRQVTGRPVTASHELSPKLGGPRRALTAVLNARLLATIDRLNRAVSSVLRTRSISAPLMVVRGDGSLVTADFAASRPIETILSGPAASVIGALHLAGRRDGLVVDVGGTTTDVAVLAEGRPRIVSTGAVVGSHRTMVEAVEMTTIGLGGDSEVNIDSGNAEHPIRLGPQRAVPIAHLAAEQPQVVAVLDRQLTAPVGSISHARFLVAVGSPEVHLDDARARQVLDRLGAGPLPISEAAPSGLDARAVDRLRTRGLVRTATLTPTDAALVLGLATDLQAPADCDAAAKAARLLARQTVARGAVLAGGEHELCSMVIDQLVRRSADFVIRAGLNADGIDASGAHAVLDASLDGHQGVARVAIGLSHPLVAVGAPAATYYRQVAAGAGTEAVCPEHGEVANAIGAVVGRVRVSLTATITQPTKGQFRVHMDDQPTFGSVDRAREHAEAGLRAQALASADSAGAATPEVKAMWTQRTALVDGKEVFVEATLTVEAAGRPRL